MSVEKQVVQPSHYQNEGGKECILLMQDAFGKQAVEQFCLLNTFKYLYRQDKKGVSETDINKARWYFIVYQMLCEGYTLEQALEFVRSDVYKNASFPAFDFDAFNKIVNESEQNLHESVMGFLYADLAEIVQGFEQNSIR
jgi:hypothetical protein